MTSEITGHRSGIRIKTVVYMCNSSQYRKKPAPSLRTDLPKNPVK